MALAEVLNERVGCIKPAKFGAPALFPRRPKRPVMNGHLPLATMHQIRGRSLMAPTL
jgi:hypothetical protein